MALARAEAEVQMNPITDQGREAQASATDGLIDAWDLQLWQATGADWAEGELGQGWGCHGKASEGHRSPARGGQGPRSGLRSPRTSQGPARQLARSAPDVLMWWTVDRAEIIVRKNCFDYHLDAHPTAHSAQRDPKGFPKFAQYNY